MGVPQDLLRVSVVIPLSGAGQALATLLTKIDAYTHAGTTPLGRRFRVEEVLLVRDQGASLRDSAVHALEQQYPWLRPVWLSRDFGRHAATLAGMTSAGGQWIVTMSEDGADEPSLIPVMLDAAYEQRAQLVYGPPANRPNQSASRRAGPRLVDGLFTRLLAPGLKTAHLDSTSDYRLVLGEVGRSVAAYAGPGVHLDGALDWVVSSVVTVPEAVVTQHASPAHGGRRASSEEPQALRVVSLLGALSILVALALFVWLISRYLTGTSPNAEWTVVLIALAFIGGVLLLGLGVIAQYAQAAANVSFGKPLYIVVSDPSHTFPETSDTPETNNTLDP